MNDCFTHGANACGCPQWLVELEYAHTRAADPPTHIEVVRAPNDLQASRAALYSRNMPNHWLVKYLERDDASDMLVECA